MPRDPVCGMNVRDDKDSIRTEHQGQVYHFCSNRCRQEFDRDPSTFVRQEGRSRDARKDISHDTDEDKRPR